MASAEVGGGLADPVLSSGDCRTINIKIARNRGFPVTEVVSENTLPDVGGEQADSVPANVEEWGLQEHQDPYA